MAHAQQIGSNIYTLERFKVCLSVWSGLVRSVPIEFPCMCISVNPRNLRTHVGVLVLTHVSPSSLPMSSHVYVLV